MITSRLAAAAVVTTWIGVGLTLPYYGAEDFGLHGAARSGVPDLVGLADAVRFSPVATTSFAVGLLALGAGAVLTAVAVWRSGVLPARVPVNGGEGGVGHRTRCPASAGREVG